MKDYQEISEETAALLKETVALNKTVKQQRYEIRETLSRNKDGRPASTIRNCVTVLENDPILKDGIAYNEMSGKIDIVKNLGWKKDYPTITDTDIAHLLLYVEDYYGLTMEDKMKKALSVVADRHRYHPIRKELESLEWDGQERIKDCLLHFLGVKMPEYPDYPYEVLKLYMMGAIHRVFQPGCKFEILLVLVGGQGAGKSTFFRYLALKDEWFTDDLKNLEDKKVYEKIEGMWIIEFSEMLATGNAKSVEAIKAFISRQSDNYRTPYKEHSRLRPRQCVFGGSSNTLSFLPKDRSWNRRFVPVMVNMEKAEVHILQDPEASREYFRQLWAEAMVLYRKENCNPKLTFSKDLEKFLKDYQREFMPEDLEVGMIQDYLDTFKGNKVCSIQLYKEALNHPVSDLTQWELRGINEIMNSSVIEGWRLFKNPRRFQEYGRQRGWERISDVHGTSADNQLPDNEDADGFVPVNEQMVIPFDE